MKTSKGLIFWFEAKNTQVFRIEPITDPCLEKRWCVRFLDAQPPTDDYVVMLSDITCDCYKPFYPGEETHLISIYALQHHPNGTFDVLVPYIVKVPFTTSTHEEAEKTIEALIEKAVRGEFHFRVNSEWKQLLQHGLIEIPTTNQPLAR